MNKETYRRVGEPVGCFDAFAKLLGEPGVKIAHEGWAESDFITVVNGRLVDERQKDYSIHITVDYPGLWYLVKEVADSPEKLQLIQEVEGLKAALAELEKKVEKLK